MSKKVRIFSVVIVSIGLIAYLTANQFLKCSSPSSSDLGAKPKIETYDPPFTKEGELEIIDDQNEKIIKKISIEIADNEKEITQGLMYRSHMIDTLGMLFVFPDPMEQSFWMKNTKIPLDIIFIDENLKIVTIQRNTTPYSESSIPSEKEVLYVLEVNAGFSDRNGIAVGDVIRYSPNSI